MKSMYAIALSLALLIPGAVSTQAAEESVSVDFSADIQPILLNRCLECHGPEKQKGRLRLDSKAETFKEDYIVIPGKAEESELFIRIALPAGHDDIMPATGEPLTKEQVDLVKAWINAGAAWPDDLVIKLPEDPNAEKDPRIPVEPSAEEKQAIEKLADLGVPVRPLAMNVTWTLANFRGVQEGKESEALALLSKVNTLEDLNLAGANIQDQDLRHISGLTNLVRLHLEKTPVTDAGLIHLKDLVHLKYLNLYDTKVSDAGLIYLTGLKALRNVYLWQSQVTATGAEQLRLALTEKVDVNRGWETAALAEPVEEQGEEAEEESQEEEKPEAEKPESDETKKEEAAANVPKKD